MVNFVFTTCYRKDKNECDIITYVGRYIVTVPWLEGHSIVDLSKKKYITIGIIRYDCLN